MKSVLRVVTAHCVTGTKHEPLDPRRLATENREYPESREDSFSAVLLY